MGDFWQLDSGSDIGLGISVSQWPTTAGALSGGGVAKLRHFGSAVPQAG
ncbi:MAG TPA: hypothetical protein VMV23_11915 [Candidatus Nanopelagicaceae bacterium]|nr:hypothetical protein [Candidatus Nanopelagicaceae bacterium]